MHTATPPLRAAESRSKAAVPEADLLRSGGTGSRKAAARVGYVPVPLDQAPLGALANIPIYLHTGAKAGQLFTLYSAESARFSQRHRERLQEAGVRFIYIPMEHQRTFQRQMEAALESVAADPKVALSAKAALVYETSLELINEVMAEQSIQESIPRLSNVARAVSSMVMSDRKSFSHFFATAQHDFYTATHMVNVGMGMTSLAYIMGMTDPAVLSSACTAGMLHDVGKMFVSEEILNKPGKLSDAEWEMLRSHPERGHDHLLKQGVTDEVVLRVTLEHHERADGTGYPKRLKTDQMHMMSRICAVVDSFDAMTAIRPFKNRVKTVAQAVAILHAEAGICYDAAIVQAWIGMLNDAASDGMIGEPVMPDASQGKLGRRAHERFAIDCRADIQVLSADGTQQGPVRQTTAHNLSVSGIALLSKCPLELSAHVRICLRGTGTLENRIAEGKVVRCRAYQDGNYDIGIRFNQQNQEQAAAQRAVAQTPA